MRWDALFADLEAQLAAEGRRGRDAEIQEMVRIERAQLPLASRLAGHAGSDIAVTLAGGLRLHGVLRHVGRGWVSLAAGPVEYVVPDAALRTVEGPGPRAAPAPAGAGAVTLRQALRALARDRARVVVHGTEGRTACEGTLDQVGADYLQVAAHGRDEYRRAGAVSGVVLVPLAAVAAVQRD